MAPHRQPPCRFVSEERFAACSSFMPGKQTCSRTGRFGLLEEIADSISFAMDHLEQEEKRRQAEESLRQREAQYRAVIETSADGFWMANEEGRILR